MRAYIPFALVCAGCNVATDFDELYQRNAIAGDSSSGDSSAAGDRDGDPSGGDAACPGHWTGANCDECSGNWNLDTDCTTCISGFADVDGDDCGTCVRYVSVSSGSPTGDASTWADAANYLQGGIVAAQQAIAASGGTITSCHVWVAAGTYHPTQGTGASATFMLEDNVELYGGFAPDDDWSARDPDANISTLDGSPDSVNHVVTAANATVLDGFTVTGGSAYGLTDDARRGAGLLVEAVSIEVNGCTFDDNQARDGGGAVYVDATGSANFTGCTFRENAAEIYGGAIQVAGGNVVVLDSTFTSNTGRAKEDGDGGAIFVQNGDLTIRGSRFLQNESIAGGALRLNGSTATIETSDFEGNFVTGYNSRGGAVVLNGGTLEASRTRFAENTGMMDGMGGAVHISGAAVAQFTNCIFIGNQTDGSSVVPEGGAVYMGGDTVTFMNCTFAGNSALGGSGGPPPATGGAIYLASGALEGTNTIVWNNSPNGATDGSGVLDGGWATYSDLQDNTGHPDNENISDDPEFVSATDLHLNNPSGVCVNEGTTAGAPTDDYDGLTRIGVPDIGAYEYR